MKRLPFKKIDAFATEGSAGNPAGAVYLNSPDELSPAQMQRIAAELKGFVNEVGYLYRMTDDTFGLKYYSSEREVAFCGHATIAIMYDLLKGDAELSGRPGVQIVTSMGTSLVQNRIPDEDAVFISSPSPRFADVSIPAAQVAEALGLAAGDIRGDAAIELVNAGLDTLIVPLRGLPTILGMQPDFSRLKRFCESQGIDIVTVYSAEVANPANFLRTRVFAPRFGYLEDPATGSGNAALGHYLLKHGQWDGGVISLEQNGRHDRPNMVKLMTRDDPNGQQEVAFGGAAMVRISGEYCLV